MATTPTEYKYFPAISDLISVDDLPEILSFIKQDIQNILDEIYYKDYQSSKSIDGSSAFYSLDIISRRKLSVNIFETGISFVLNPDHSDTTISSFPVTLFWEWEILKFVNYFNTTGFSFSTEAIFEKMALNYLFKNFYMKNLFFIITMLWIIPASCQTTNKMKLDCIKIIPVGISDLPRDTIYIRIKTDSITNSFEDEKLIQRIITDVSTFLEMTSFIKINVYNKNSPKKNFNEYGSFNISGYYEGLAIISYNLNRSDSKKYFNSIIDILVSGRKDVKLIRALKEQCLDPINY